MKRHVTVLCILAFGVSGCAFGDRVATLKYPPRPDSGSAQAATKNTQPPKGRTARPAIVIGEFIDSRENKKNVGFVQNTYGMKTANVNTDSDVSEWVRKAAAHELQSRGYSVSMAQSAKPGSRALLVSGNIEKILTKGVLYLRRRGRIYHQYCARKHEACSRALYGTRQRRSQHCRDRRSFCAISVASLEASASELRRRRRPGRAIDAANVLG